MKLDLPALESWLWEAACVIRGPVDAPKFKDYILPLIFLKRVSDVFEDEIRDMEAEFGTRQKALKLADADHQLVRFFVPEKARWAEVAKRTKGVGEYLTDAVRAVARVNPRLQGVIDITDFNATTSGQRMLDDDHLASLVQILNQHRLGLEDVEKDILGQAYEYLLRKFAEGQGSSAGEFLTPPEVALLMAMILDPQPGQSVYDSNCGTAGLLIKAHLRLIDKFGVKGNGSKKLPPKVAPLKLFGQEINPSTFAMARMNAFIHDMEAEIALGDTMTTPRFTQRDGSLRRFDRVTANPMWNQKFAASLYENDTWAGSPAASRPPPAPIGAGFSTCTPRWPTPASWLSCSTPAPSAGAAATRARTRSATFAGRSSRPTLSKPSCSCRRTCSTTPPRRASSSSSTGASRILVNSSSSTARSNSAKAAPRTTSKERT